MDRMIEAAQIGDINVLYESIQKDPYVLEHIDQVPFLDTPLHIAAAAGHADFVTEMMNLKPSFSRKLNQAGFSPMHLSLENEKRQVALRLLRLDKGLVRVKGREGLTPLHHVVRTGNLDLLIKFLKVCPEAIEDMTVRDESSLHLAVKSDMLEALQVLVGWLQRSRHQSPGGWENKLLACGDNDGNTVLHIAAKIDRAEVVKLLLDSFHHDLYINARNFEGLTALDILNRENPNSSIKKMIRNAGGLSSAEPDSLPPKNPNSDSIALFKSKMSWFQNLVTAVTPGKKEISDELRNAFLVVTVLIITATFGSSANPPSKDMDENAWWVISVYSLFWLYNTLIFWAAIGLTAYLLPRRTISLFLLLTLCAFGSCYTFLLATVSFKGVPNPETKEANDYYYLYKNAWIHILCIMSHVSSFFISVLVSYQIARYVSYMFVLRTRRKFYLIQALCLFILVATTLAPTIYITESFL